MRNAFAAAFHEEAKKDERLAMVVADISAAGAMDKFRAEFPQRFVNTGVAEQIMIGICAGMAMRGLKPFAYTIATFALYRPFEFIRDDLAYQNLPVTVVGIGGGVTYSQLGGTHHAMEDVAVATAIPGLRVIAPCDPRETRAATQWCARQEDGPVYLRLGKAGEKDLGGDAPWQFGKLRPLREGREACIIGYGPILSLALEATEGCDVAVVSCHTLKPLDLSALRALVVAYDRIVVLEEATPWLAWRIQALAGKKIDAITLKDEFIHKYGSHADLLAAHGITKASILARI